jgi:hypothetical protein
MKLNRTEKVLESIGELESSIISANKKYFGVGSESQRITHGEPLLYDTLLRYFKANP